MTLKEKARQAGEPIPDVCQDNSEISIAATAEQLQSRRASRIYAVSVAVARTIAELAFFAGCPR